MKYLLLILATVCASSKAIICKKISHGSGRVRDVLFLNANIFAIGAITILICHISKIKSFFEISTFSFILALIFAAFLLFTQITQIFAMSHGLISLSSFIYSCGFLVPIFYSAIFLDESVSLYQILGIALLIVSLVIILPPDRDGRFSFAWLSLAIASMLGSGANAVIQKIHQSSDFKGELVPFIFYAFLFASVLSFIFSIFGKKDTGFKNSSLYSKKSSVILMLIGGIVVGGLNVVNLKLAGTLPAVIHFPVYNVCSMILTAVLGKILFGEIIGKRKLMGYVAGLCAICVIGLL